MVVLLGICVVVLVLMGFSQPAWWLAAAVLVYLAVWYGKGSVHRADGQGGYGEYRARREQRDKWDRKYRRQHRGQHITPDRPPQ
ncbi:hypothetical protein GCM10010329_85410 [Streptomyces spiroverticillatus]|uniref:Uncharacterized protein n=1 Tax=Streptomyces finlayi TaxID=67296 RepID=A0A918XA31_9ACTN|nr:hypothetical protein [Streptomyces finlayi]GHA50266.1 hypothetical protein GCM10010329_85410 [Streptomyces spiroverticillatus]GHD19785.1 hypothetical protein GCM10010334_83720 [Streptomyces finlayi]